MTKFKRELALAAAAVMAAGAMTCGAAEEGAKTKGETPKPKAYLVADAHLDTQWNWDIQTTIGQYVWNTINQNLALLERYPEYVFNFEGGVKYAWMKEYFPREYELMKKYIAEDRWHICGSSWDATDALVPSVESALRNIMLGQNLYRQEFGVESTDIFLPDCFGFGWTLPTIANHCGLIGFSSQKLGWRHNNFHGNSRYPFNVGLWQGIDGSRVMMAHGYGYGHRWDYEDLTVSPLIKEHLAESPVNVVYNYYGTGDIGGSPSLTSVDAVERAVNKKDGDIEIISAQSDRMYKDYLPYESHPELPVYDGELLMDVHGTGCYTSQAAMKRYNRQNEQLGDAAERVSVMAELLGTADYPSGKITDAWKRFIFHQFHDDLTGTSIPRAYEFSWNDELLSLKDFADVTTHGVSAVASRMDTRAKGTPVVLYNPLGFEVSTLVEVSVPAKARPAKATVINDRGETAEAQVIGYADGKATLLVDAEKLPANGMAVYDVRLSGKGKAPAETEANALENSRYRITFDPNGDITSLYDKTAGKEMVKEGKAIRLAMFTENESFPWPAWEILKKTIDGTPESITGDVKMTLVADGPLRKTLKVSKRHGDSQFDQYISLSEGPLSHRVDFYNEIDWKSMNSLLKAEFPMAYSNPEATYDLGLGTVRRGNNTENAYEVYAQQWADLTGSDNSYGVTVMNDCKYGWDKPDDSTLRLTLLHTPKTKDGYKYQDHQDLGHHTFTYSIVGHDGALDQAAAGRDAEVLNQQVKAFVVAPHKGDLGRSYSLASIDNPNLAIKALKKAEASDEYVVRVYDTAGNGTQKGQIAFAFPIEEAVAADGTEKTIGKATFLGNNLNVEVTPNSIRTYKVKLRKDPKAAEKEMLQLPLAYNKKCMSWNEFRGEANFNSGYSYAAEMIPSEIKWGDVAFALNGKELYDGMECRGDTLRLPAGHRFNRVYLLASAATEEGAIDCDVRAGKQTTHLTVPSYTGFIGQWGHDEHTKGYLEPATVAYTGTHRHSAEGDVPYEFTYLFSFPVDIPAKATEVILPNEPGVVLFAATAVREDLPQAEAAAPLFRTNNVCDTPERISADEAAAQSANLLSEKNIIGWSGFVNDGEHPRKMVDGDENTKWCDTGAIPCHVDFDLGEKTEINSWRVVNAATENMAYVTATCLLQGRDNPGEEWRTLDSFTGNKRNVVSKKLAKPESVRYVRLNVIQPVQSPDGRNARIYEFGVYK